MLRTPTVGPQDLSGLVPARRHRSSATTTRTTQTEYSPPNSTRVLDDASSPVPLNPVPHPAPCTPEPHLPLHDPHLSGFHRSVHKPHGRSGPNGPAADRTHRSPIDPKHTQHRASRISRSGRSGLALGDGFDFAPSGLVVAFDLVAQGQTPSRRRVCWRTGLPSAIGRRYCRSLSDLAHLPSRLSEVVRPAQCGCDVAARESRDV